LTDLRHARPICRELWRFVLMELAAVAGANSSLRRIDFRPEAKGI